MAAALLPPSSQWLAAALVVAVVGGKEGGKEGGSGGGGAPSPGAASAMWRSACRAHACSASFLLHPMACRHQTGWRQGKQGK